MSDQSLNEKGKMPKKFSVKSGDKSKAGGLTAKGVKRYRAANPGSKLKTAVTTKPSKLKKGSKSANRRKSFCARMGGMKKRLTSAKTRRDPDSRINKALRKWNCSTDVNPNMKASIAESFLEQFKNIRSVPQQPHSNVRDTPATRRKRAADRFFKRMVDKEPSRATQVRQGAEAAGKRFADIEADAKRRGSGAR